MADYIPLKIQTEIMKRLPVISLIQFRSVSKQWKSIIDSPEFIAHHCVIHHHTQSQHRLLLSYLESGVSSSSMGMMPSYISIVDDDTFPHKKVLMTTPLSVKGLLCSYTKEVVAVSGGLFCFYGSIFDVKNAVIWNPSVKKTLTIPVPNTPDDFPYDTMVGFAVCPRTSDLKLVKITYIYVHQEEYPSIPNQVEVFSLSSGLWKPPRGSGKLPRKPIVYKYPQVSINDSIYWLADDKSSSDRKDQYCHLIMSFNITSEEFTEIYLPPSLASRKTHVCISISKLNDSLVVIEKSHHSNANVWIMHNGDPPSFIHIFTIDMPILSARDVAGFTKNGAPLLLKKIAVRENELIVYDPNSKQIIHTGIAGPFYYFFASPYTQTLLLLGHKDSVDSETPDGIGTRSGPLCRVARNLQGVTTFSSATSSSTSYYRASKRYYSQEEVDEIVQKKSRRLSACLNKKLDNLMTQLADKGITLDKTLVIGEEDEEDQVSFDEAMDVLDEEVEYKMYHD